MLRERWGFKGFVASDCGAVEAVHWPHGFSKYALLSGSERSRSFDLYTALPVSCQQELAVLLQQLQYLLADHAAR